MKKIAFLLIILSTPSFAGLNEYFSTSRSLRALGMGNAYYALSDDEYALFYNPAGLSLYEGEWQLMFPIRGSIGQGAITEFSTIESSLSGSSGISQIVTGLESLQGKPFSAGFGLMPFFMTKHFAVALLLADTKMNLSTLGKGVDSEAQLTAISDSGLILGYGRDIGNLHLGVNLKLLARAGGTRTYTTLEIAQNQASTTNLRDLGGFGGGIDFDLGAIYEFPEGLFPFALAHRVSLTFNNVLASSFTIQQDGTPPQNPRYASLGTYTLLKGIGPISNFIFLFDISELDLGGQSDPKLGARKGSIWKHLNWGLEMPMGRIFALRSGFHQGAFTVGMGLNLKYMKLDLAWFGEELGQGVDRISERRIALRLAFGGGSLYNRAVTAESLAAERQKRREREKARNLVKEKKLKPSKSERMKEMLKSLEDKEGPNKDGSKKDPLGDKKPVKEDPQSKLPEEKKPQEKAPEEAKKAEEPKSEPSSDSSKSDAPAESKESPSKP